MEFFKQLFKNMNGKQKLSGLAIVTIGLIALVGGSDIVNIKHGDDYLGLAPSNDDILEDTDEE